MPTVQHIRGTKANLDTLAAGTGLLVGQIYFCTDTNQIAMALTTSTYQLYVKGDTSVSVGTVAPSGPATGDLWVDTN